MSNSRFYTVLFIVVLSDSFILQMDLSLSSDDSCYEKSTIKKDIPLLYDASNKDYASNINVIENVGENNFPIKSSVQGAVKIRINEINYDAPGVENPEEEFIELFVLVGGINLSYWYVTDWDDNDYWEIPTISPFFSAGDYIVLHLGSGIIDNDGPIYHYYMNETTAKLSNLGEPITLFEDNDSTHDRIKDTAHDFVVYGVNSEGELALTNAWCEWPNNNSSATDFITPVGADYESIQLIGTDLDNGGNWWSAKPTAGQANELVHKFFEEFNTTDYQDTLTTTAFGWGGDTISLGLVGCDEPIYRLLAYADDVFVTNGYAFIASIYYGLAIVNISDPLSPGSPVYVSTPYATGVFVSGDYAYVADLYDGLAIIDISDPQNPGEPLYQATNGARDVYISGNYAYIADYMSGLTIIDISDPLNPGQPINRDTDGQAESVFVSGNYAYIAIRAGFAVIDISDPTDPGIPYYHHTTGNAWKIYIWEDFAYIADGSGGLAIMSISQPTNTSTPVHQMSIDGEPNRLFVVDDFVYVTLQYPRGIAVINVSNPNEPKFILSQSITGSPRGIYVLNNYVYVVMADPWGLAIINTTSAFNIVSPSVAQTKSLYDSSGFVQNVTLNANQTVYPSTSINHFISSDGLEWSPITNNETYTFKTNNYNKLYWKAILIANENQTNYPSIDSLTIDFDTYYDTTFPVIQLENIQNNTSIGPNSAVTINIDDFTLCSSWYNWDDTPNQTFFDPYSVVAPTLEGYHVLTIYANDSVGHVTKQEYRWWINQAPSISLLSPTNNSIQKDGTIIILNIEDKNLDVSWYNWDNGVNQSFVTPWNVSLSLADGWHWLNVYANDTAGALTVKRYHFYCEAKAPVITLIDLQNDTTLTSSAIVQLNISDYSLDDVWYNWDGNVNQTLTSPYNIVVPSDENYHWLTVYANDSVGHLTVKKYRWWINQVPSINLESPANNTIQKDGTSIILSIEDNNLDDVWYKWDNDVNQSFVTPWNVSLSLADGWHWLNVYANDTSGFLSVNQFYFYCDVDSPVILLTTPENDSIITSATLIHLNITDFSPVNSWYRWDQGNNQSFNDPWQVNPPSTEGIHMLTVYAEDSVGHLTVENYIFTINVAPEIILNTPLNGSRVTVGMYVDFTFTDEIGGLQWIWYNWDDQTNVTLDNLGYWSLTEFTYNSWSVPETEGWHNWTINVNDTYGLVNTIILEVYVDVTPPVITLHNPDNDTSIENSLVIELAVTDYSLDSVWYNWDGATNQILVSPYEVSVPTDEGYHWLTVYANDFMGHSTVQMYRWSILIPTTTTTTTTSTTSSTSTPSTTTTTTSTTSSTSTPSTSTSNSIPVLTPGFNVLPFLMGVFVIITVLRRVRR